MTKHAEEEPRRILDGDDDASLAAGLKRLVSSRGFACKRALRVPMAGKGATEIPLMKYARRAAPESESASRIMRKLAK